MCNTSFILEDCCSDETGGTEQLLTRLARTGLVYELSALLTS